MSATIPLGELTLQQVGNLLKNISFSMLVPIAEEKEIDGLALDSVEKLENLAEVFPILPAMKLNALLTKITQLKETGVSHDLLLSQKVELSPQLSQKVELSPQLPHFAADGACIQYEELAESSLYVKCSSFLDKPITFNDSIEAIRSKLESEPIGKLNMVGLDIVATSAIHHGNTCDKNGIDISSDEIAAIGAYTEESELYKVLNKELRSTARSNLAPFIQFIILLTRAIAKCPVPVVGVVYRAFKDDVSKDYITDKKITWAQLSSSTTNIKEAENFLSEDNNGVMKGTLFIIELSEKDSSRSIQAFSTIAKENEVLFAPMSSFQVSNIMDTKSGLIIVHLCTIPSTRCLLKYVSLPSSALGDSSSSSALGYSSSSESALGYSSSSSSALGYSSSSASALGYSSSSSSALGYSSSSASSSSALGYSSSSAPKVVLADWECSACTFINKGTLFICELCGGAKCGKATTQVPEAPEVPEVPEVPEISEVSEVSEVKKFTFNGLFNSNKLNTDGVLFYIGTKGSTQLYRNPHEAGYVVASRSSDGMFGGGDVWSLVGRDSKINVTADREKSWMAVDLGAHRSLVVSYFCLRYGWNFTSAGIHFPQNFELQGSNCETTTDDTWVPIQRHEGDTFNDAPACPSPSNFGENQPWAHWPVAPTNGATGAFRHFRIFQFGPHQGGRHVLALSGLELYGELIERSF